MEGDPSWDVEAGVQAWSRAAQTATRRMFCFMVRSFSLEK